MTFDPHDRPIYEQVAHELLFTPDGDAIRASDAGADDDLIVQTDNGTQRDDPVEQPPQDRYWMPAPPPVDGGP